MKKLLILLAVTAFTTTAVMAQEQPKQPSQEKMKQDKAEWDKKIKEELKLTPEQIQKYDALNKECSEKIGVVANDATLNDDAKKEKKMALKKERESKFLEILTPEQQTKYKEIIEKKKAGK